MTETTPASSSESCAGCYYNVNLPSCSALYMAKMDGHCPTYRMAKFSRAQKRKGSGRGR